MTEYEKLITAEQIAHTVEITECLTGKTGMANTCAGRVALFYGAEDGNDDKIVTPRTFSRQFKIQRPYWDKAADHPTKIVGKCVST